MSDLLNIPAEVSAFFGKKGSATEIVNLSKVIDIVGGSTISLEKYDIYVMGKRSGESRPSFYTKLRVECRAQARNQIQGLLGIRFLEGYGYEKAGRDNSLKVMRPSDVQKYVTQDSASFKKRAVIHIGPENVLSLCMAEPFCRIPLMDENLLATTGKKSNARKREAYARKKARRRDWVHMTREATVKKNYTRMHQMLLAYKRSLGETEYFSEFVKDVSKTCSRLRSEFGIDNGCQDQVLLPQDENQDPDHSQPRDPENTDVVTSETLRGIPISEVGW
ncbi:unknown [Feldmannia species virus]|uniref:Uncharacterized protein n=1 Tax=Feldmannia species virus TaxID=39420 RepID=B5LWC1_9PHYC|nr:hypothetical protein FeldSpV_gp032 [Feldmannia species virus]ACH46784.1 unknown [Feldmannia species virus]